MSYFKNLIILLFCMVISSCTWSGCVDADDFGFEKFTISASGYGVYGSGSGQVSEWKDIGSIYNGDPLYLVVKNGDNSRWTAWYCNQESSVSSCGFMSSTDTVCSASNWCTISQDEPDQYITLNDVPCIFEKGKGAYILIADPAEETYTPNSNLAILRDPYLLNVETYHLGEGTVTYNGEEVGGVSNKTFNNVGGRAYFKILDSYYNDNAGKYNIIVKRGLTDPSTGPIEKIIEYTKNKLDKVPEAIFNNIIVNSDFVFIIKTVLQLVIIFMAVGYLAGVVEISQKEIMVRLLKMVVIIQLITQESSWNFFNNNFFQLFTKGVDEILSMTLGNLLSNGSIHQTGLRFFDQVINLFFSTETSNKIWSLLFTSGFLVIPIIYVGIALIIFAISKTVIVYLFAYIIICLLIAIAPIFLTFMLFQITRSLFDTWITQLISYTIQPIITMIALGFMINMILNQFYKVLGFPVCVKTLINVLNTDLLDVWYPVNITEKTATIDIPGYIIDPNDSSHLCSPYECQAERYVDLPYLDMKSDAQLISDLQNGVWGSLLLEAIIFVMMVFLLLKLYQIIPALARGLAGTPFSQAGDMARLAESAIKGGVEFARQSLSYAAMSTNTGKAIRRFLIDAKDNGLGQTLKNLKIYEKDKDGKLIEYKQDEQGNFLRDKENKLIECTKDKDGKYTEKGKYQEKELGKIAGFGLGLAKITGTILTPLDSSYNYFAEKANENAATGHGGWATAQRGAALFVKGADLVGSTILSTSKEARLRRGELFHTMDKGLKSLPKNTVKAGIYASSLAVKGTNMVGTGVGKLGDLTLAEAERMRFSQSLVIRGAGYAATIPAGLVGYTLKAAGKIVEKPSQALLYSQNKMLKVVDEVADIGNKIDRMSENRERAERTGEGYSLTSAFNKLRDSDYNPIVKGYDQYTTWSHGSTEIALVKAGMLSSQLTLGAAGLAAATAGGVYGTVGGALYGVTKGAYDGGKEASDGAQKDGLTGVAQGAAVAKGVAKGMFKGIKDGVELGSRPGRKMMNLSKETIVDGLKKEPEWMKYLTKDEEGDGLGFGGSPKKDDDDND